MAPKNGPALALRVPGDARRKAHARSREVPHDPDRPRLRLVVTKGRLGVELEQPFELGPIAVAQLQLLLPDIRFPVELTGGVGAFRNRRGQVESLGLCADLDSVRRWARARLRGLLGEGLPELLVAPVEDGWLVGLAQARAALRFELLVAPLGADLRLLPVAARGHGLTAPPQQLAVRVVELLAKPLGRRSGGLVVVEGAARAVSRALLPLSGMRAAATDGVAWSCVSHALGESRIDASYQEPPPPFSERLVSAVELAVLAFAGDDALCRGDLELARREYLRALGQAPRHPELADRVAEVDACVGGRAEAALGMIAEVRQVIDAGPLAARLLGEVGDEDSACEAYRRAADREPFGALAALCWTELADRATEPSARLAAWDQAVARAPLLMVVRRGRFAARLAAGDLRGARDDAAHLEASATGAHERHDELRAVAEAFGRSGHETLAADTFERALRYVPDSVVAVAGLARCYRQLGRGRRALDLFGRALALADRFGQNADDVQLDIAKALVELADDRPAAISHVRQVAPFAPRGFEARLLEARWRADIGDLAGASVALGRLAEAVEHAGPVLLGQTSLEPPFEALWGERSPWPRREDARVAVAAMLLEGALLHDELRGDRASGRALIALALRLAPRDRAVLSAHRRLYAGHDVATDDRPSAGPRPAPRPPVASAPTGELVGDSEPPRSSDSDVAMTALLSGDPLSSASDAPMASPLSEEPSRNLGGLSLDEADLCDPEDEQLITQLTEQLRATPGHRPTVLGLSAALQRVGRHLDRLALLTAAIEEGDEPLRAELGPQRRSVLEQLRDDARARGAEQDVELYELMLSSPNVG